MSDTQSQEALRLAGWLTLCAESVEHIKASNELRRLHAEVEALRAEVDRLRLMQPVTIGPTGQSNMLTAGEIAAIDAARKEST